MYQSKTVVTIKKCKHKNRNARTQTKMHDSRKLAQNGSKRTFEDRKPLKAEVGEKQGYA